MPPGAAMLWSRAARLSVSPVADSSDAGVPAPPRPTTTNPVAIPILVCKPLIAPDKPSSFETTGRETLADSSVDHDRIQGRCIGRDLEVPAGKFQAFKIVTNGWVKDKTSIHEVGGDIRAAETYWYAPTAKRLVKYQGRHIKWVPPVFEETWALSYELRSLNVKNE